MIRTTLRPVYLFVLAVLTVALFGAAASADAPATSKRPVPRPMVVVETGGGVLAAPVTAEAAAIPFMAAAAATVAPSPTEARRLVRMLRPKPRPEGLVTRAAAAVAPADKSAATASASAAASSAAAGVALGGTGAGTVASAASQPPARKGLFGFLKPASATRTQPGTEAIIGRAGSVCGVPGIKGRTIAPVKSRVKACGIADAVEVTSVDGVALSPAAIMDCPTAVALNAWIRGGAKPAVGNTGGGIAALRVAASYDCRPRNNVPGARISEHGKGKAIDISAIVLATGDSMDVAGDFRRGKYSKPLKAMHRAACGPFGTTLGPGSDGRHEDHFHFDSASYRSGPYCK